jgi:hypothetical protein
MRRRWALAALGSLAVTCGEPQAIRDDTLTETRVQEREELGFASLEEMEAELETLDNEILGLEEYLAANPGWTPPGPTDPDPFVVLEAARRTREAAESALDAADTAQAADSLRAAAARIEHVKRLLGVAEEMGIEFEPAAESLPPSD